MSIIRYQTDIVVHQNVFLKESRDFLLYKKKEETSRVLFYDKTWLLLFTPVKT